MKGLNLKTQMNVIVVDAGKAFVYEKSSYSNL